MPPHTLDGVITGELEGRIDRVWDAFWSGGISNPLEVTEQVTYLLFLRRLDEQQTAAERELRRLGSTSKPMPFPERKEHLRWSRLRELGDTAALHRVMGGEVFPDEAEADAVVTVLRDIERAAGPSLQDEARSLA